MKLTLRIRLEPDEWTHQELLHTIEACSQAANFVSQWVYENRVFGQYSIHEALYREIRAKFCLPAQLAVGVIGKVCDTYKTERANAKRQERDLCLCQFRHHSATVYDSRVLTYQGASSVSLRILSGRRVIPVTIHDKERFSFCKGETDLIYENGSFFLLQTCDVPEPEPLPVSDCLGVDLGIRHIAFDSDHTPYTDPGIEKRRKHYEQRRTCLKQTKSKNARRRLKKLGRKERRFRRWVNHTLSKRLVEKAKGTCRGIALEALGQFFDKTTVRKSRRAQRSSWSFRQLREFISYKACLSGIPLFLVEPAYTSQECSQCHYIAKANRPTTERFCCLRCGYATDADANASQTIRFRAVVNLPKLYARLACIEGEAVTTG